MKIVIEPPPNFGEIVKVLPVVARWRGVLFCYGNTIFNPNGVAVPAEIIAHEEKHSARQGNDPKGWWDRYLSDVEFRFEQELEGYTAQYRHVLLSHASRHDRRRALKLCAASLAAPIYGAMVSEKRARQLLQDYAL